MASTSSSTSGELQLSNGSFNSEKRARADTAGDVQQSKAAEHEVEGDCGRPNEHVATTLPLEEAASNPKLAKETSVEYYELKLEGSNEGYDFDSSHSKDVWHRIDEKYSSRSGGSREYDMSVVEVADSVHRDIRDIVGTVRPWSPYATKHSALETLRKIGKTVCLSSEDSMGGHDEVRKEGGFFFQQSVMEDGMRHVVRSMTDDERQQMCEHGNGEFIDKFRELVQLAEDYRIMEHLHKVLHKLQHKRRRRGSGASDADDHLGEEETESEDELPDPGDYD